MHFMDWIWLEEVRVDFSRLFQFPFTKGFMHQIRQGEFDKNMQNCVPFTLFSNLSNLVRKNARVYRLEKCIASLQKCLFLWSLAFRVCRYGRFDATPGIRGMNLCEWPFFWFGSSFFYFSISVGWLLVDDRISNAHLNSDITSIAFKARFHRR